MAPVAVKAGKRKSVLLSLASYAILGLFLGSFLTILLVQEAGWELGHAVTVSVVAIALVVPAWIALFVAGLVAWYKVSTSEKGSKGERPPHAWRRSGDS